MSIPTRSGAPAPPWLAPTVREYLGRSPRQLPSHALYDELGSALFDAICALPWYPVTRAERGLFDAHGARILDAAGPPDRIIELGCGSGEKLDRLLDVASATRGDRPHRIDLVDVSAAALALAARRLDTRNATVVAHRRRYELGLADAMASREPGEHATVMFLGSNIGNFDPPGMATFLDTVRGALQPGDTLLISADLVKPEIDLMLAYDDPLGVTAAFNRNLLVRLNRELGATFDLDAWAHRAVWNARESRMEMHLVARRRQRVEIPDADLALLFDAGEAIWTESSYKYTVEGFEATLARAGFARGHRWIDPEHRFLVTVVVAG